MKVLKRFEFVNYSEKEDVYFLTVTEDGCGAVMTTYNHGNGEKVCYPCLGCCTPKPVVWEILQSLNEFPEIKRLVSFGMTTFCQEYDIRKVYYGRIVSIKTHNLNYLVPAICLSADGLRRRPKEEVELLKSQLEEDFQASGGIALFTKNTEDSPEIRKIKERLDVSLALVKESMEIAIFRLNNDLDKIIEKLKKEAENEIEKIKKRT
jgi:hypothetical protein